MTAISEIARIRSDYVDKYVGRRIDQREGDCTSAEVEGWENQAYRQWREMFPALNDMLPSHIFTELSAS